LVANSAVKNMIKEGKSNQIYSAIQTGRQEGMQLFEHSLKALYQNGVVSLEEAMSKSGDPRALEQSFRGR